MNKYYYLIASLPSPDARLSPASSDYEDTIAFIRGLLSKSDWQLFEYLLYPADIKNIINCIARERDLPEIHPFFLNPGTLSEKVTGEFLKGKIDVGGFLGRFYEEYREQLNSMDLVDIEKVLMTKFYQTVFQQEDKFLTSYFNFDRDLKNTSITSNSRKFDFDPKKYLEGEFLADQKFIISGEYSFMEEVGSIPKDDSPRSLEKILDRIRQRYIDQLSAFSFFDLHVVFAWFLNYQIQARWTGEWTEENGKHKIDALLGRAMREFQMPELFIH